MALGWVIVGTLGQAMLAMVLFMVAVFAGGGVANGNSLSKLQIAILDVSMLALPASCLVSACVVIYLYHVGAGPMAFWWYVLPAGVLAVYAMLLSGIMR